MGRYRKAPRILIVPDRTLLSVLSSPSAKEVHHVLHIIHRYPLSEMPRAGCVSSRQVPRLNQLDRRITEHADPRHVDHQRERQPGKRPSTFPERPHSHGRTVLVGSSHVSLNLRRPAQRLERGEFRECDSEHSKPSKKRARRGDDISSSPFPMATRPLCRGHWLIPALQRGAVMPS